MTPTSKWAPFFERLIHGAEKNRAYLYRTFSGLATLTVAGGLVSDSKIGLLVAGFGVVLGIPSGLASANSSTKSN